jgi:hypothetical protein
MHRRAKSLFFPRFADSATQVEVLRFDYFMGDQSFTVKALSPQSKTFARGKHPRQWILHRF